MKTTFIPPIISKILGLKNAAGTTINPATEEISIKNKPIYGFKLNDVTLNSTIENV